MPAQPDNNDHAQNLARLIPSALDGLTDWQEKGGYEAAPHPADDTGTIVLVRHWKANKHGEPKNEARTAYVITVARCEAYDLDENGQDIA